MRGNVGKVPHTKVLQIVLNWSLKRSVPELPIFCSLPQGTVRDAHDVNRLRCSWQVIFVFGGWANKWKIWMSCHWGSSSQVYSLKSKRFEKPLSRTIIDSIPLFPIIPHDILLVSLFVTTLGSNYPRVACSAQSTPRLTAGASHFRLSLM